MNRILLSLTLALLAFSVFAQKIPFQGKLTQNDEPFSGSVTMVFSIPDISWTETHEGVAVMDGFYSVVLGEITAIPDSIFTGVDERQLKISVDGTALSPVILYKPYGGPSDGGSTTVKNPDGKLRAELNYHEKNDAGNLVLYGKNDSTNVVLGSVGGGYSGALHLFDSLRNPGVQLFTNNSGIGNLYTRDRHHNVSGWFGNQGNAGGFMQLVGYNGETGNFTGATFTGFASWKNGLPYFIMEGSSENPYTTLLEFGGHHDGKSEKPYFNLNSSSRAINEIGSALSMGISSQDLPFLELKGGNDRNWDMRAQIRVDSVNSLGTAGRIELFGPLGNENNDVNSIFSVGAVSDPDSQDPSGASAEMFLWGTSSPNFQLGGKPWEENNHASFQMFGSKTDGGGWYRSNIHLDVHNDGVYDAGNLNLNNTSDGASFNTVHITSNGPNNSGHIQLRNSANSDVVGIYDDGGTGKIDLLGTDGGRIGINAYSIAAGSDAYTNGYVINMDDTGGPLLEMYSGGSQTINIHGNSGSITATTVTQTSDARLKKNIRAQEAALEKVKMLRGVTYEWKEDESNVRNIGFIAQEVEGVFPEVIVESKEGIKSVNYAVLVSSLVEAIKELDAKVASLETENKKLKASLEVNRDEGLAKLQAEIKAIKKLLGTSVHGASK